MSMLIIGIAGGTGSGKTTVVNKIIERLAEKDVTILSQMPTTVITVICLWRSVKR